MRKLLAILFVFLLSSPAFSATSRYISTTGTATFAQSTSIGTPCSLNTFLSNATGGDVGQARAGTYSLSTTAVPANSGSDGNLITLMPYNGESVSISRTSSYSFDMTGKSYWVFDSLTITSPGWFEMSGASYITVTGCTLNGSTNSTWGGFDIIDNASYLQILNNEFNNPCYPRDSIYLRSGHHILIEGNDFLEGGSHNALTIQTPSSHHIVVRKNLFSNEYHTNSEFYSNSEWILVEDNKFFDAGEACSPTSCTENTCGQANDQARDRTEHGGVKIAGKYMIIRNNDIANNGINGIFSWASNKISNYIRVYNNTLYRNYENIQINRTPPYDVTYCDILNNIFDGGRNYNWRHSVSTGNDSTHNILGNNFFADSQTAQFYHWDGTIGASSIGQAEINHADTFDLNVEVSGLDPLFNNPASPNYDFSLTANSPMIDQGQWITDITSDSGTGTSFIVADPYKFMDGWGIPGVSGDQIQLEGSSTVLTITNVNYSTGEIQFTPETSWTLGDGVAMPYSGSKPDIGAHEFGSPPITEQAIYNDMGTDMTDHEDTGTDYNLSAVVGANGAPDHSTGDSLTIDDIGDGYYKGTIFYSNVVTVILRVKFTGVGGSYDQPMIGIYDLSGGRVYTFGLKSTQVFYTAIGINNGDSNEQVLHASSISAGTWYGAALVINSVTQRAKIFVYTYDGTLNSVGTDIDQAILASGTFNYAEGQLIAGVWENGGTVAANWYLNGELGSARIANYELPESTIEAILLEDFGGAAQSSPKVTDNYWCTTSGTALTADHEILGGNEKYCHCLEGNEEFFPPPGDSPEDFAGQVTILAQQELSIPYYSGLETTKLIFCGDSVSGQIFGDLQLDNSNPVSVGTSGVYSAQNEAFDNDGDSGLDTNLSNVYHFNARNRPRATMTSSGQDIVQTSNSRPVNGYCPELVLNSDFSSYTGSAPAVDFGGWIEYEASGDASFGYNNGGELTVVTAPSAFWHQRLHQTINVMPNESYSLNYVVNGGAANTVDVRITVQETNDDYTVFAQVDETADGSDKSGNLEISATGETTLIITVGFDDIPSTDDVLIVKNISLRRVCN